ncbi:TM0106 family RecB-like putative nuclease [Candidatus Uhrbacteria bacterium]|jgi:predicted RecB family nuclease|nr:TM0106 family RecB-like putative nuclease [Candidatus Uhrbacteria bacterium]
MSKRITQHAFYQYMKCPTWLYHEAQEGEDIRVPLIKLLQDEGLIKEQARILLSDRKVEEVDLPDLDEASVKTLELMAKGVETIYRGVLMHGRHVAQPDILERVEGDSKLGDYYYVACDIKRSRHLKDEYRFQGAFYADILKEIQGLRPVQGYVMRADRVVEGYLIDEVYANYRLTLDDIERIVDGERPEPFLTSAAKNSPWFQKLHKEVQECDHLSLINRIWRSEMDALKAVSINTVTDLAEAPEKQIKAIPGVTKDRALFLQKQAESLKENKVIFVGPVDLPPENGVVLVIDIESDPLRDIHYLIGVLRINGDVEEYIPFLARTPEEEGRMWQEFLLFIDDYPDARMYHYGWYELDVFRRMGVKYGVPDRIAKQFEERMVDVLPRLRESVIFPLSFYSLKDVAKYLGFSWRHPEASGQNSVVWYHEFLDNKDEQALQDTIDYNEDDVRATWLLRNWAVGDRSD